MADLEPGWLMRTCHRAHIECMLDHGPAALRHLAPTVLPIPKDEAGELYERMNERFKAWTGMNLTQWQGERQDG